MHLLRFWDLQNRGIPYTRKHLSWLMKQGRFPKPVRLSGNTIAWISEEIESYLAERVRARDEADDHQPRQVWPCRPEYPRGRGRPRKQQADAAE